VNTRAETVLAETPLGAVVVARADGRRWIFIGWNENTAGREMFFVRSLSSTEPNVLPPWTYHASTAETLLKKFSGLDQYRNSKS
jgi:hypothetical protein